MERLPFSFKTELKADSGSLKSVCIHKVVQEQNQSPANEPSGDDALGRTSLILFSGLAADANVFVSQKLAFPQLIVPEWPKPLPGDTLESYSDRLANDLQSRQSANFSEGIVSRADVSGGIVGGASFGGIIALHVAQRLEPSAVLLIGSVRDPTELSRLAKLCRPLKPLVPFIPVRLLQFFLSPATSRLARRFAPHLFGLARQFRKSDPMVLKWSLGQLLDWKSTPELNCPVYQIHGECDRVLPIRYTRPDTIISGGGHVISLTHAAEVNNFIRSVMQSTSV